MAVSTRPKNLNNVSVVLKDGTGTPVSLTLFAETGDFSVSGLKEVLNATTPYESRGKFIGVSHAARQYPSGSMSLIVTELSDASAGAIPDFVFRNGGYASNVSTTGSGTSQVYTIDIQVTIEGTNLGDTADHTFTLEDCEVTSFDYADGDPCTMTLAFICYGAVTGDLAAAQIA